MEPPDLPLIEISPELDSFLPQLPSGDFTGIFDCSPLHIPGSSITKANEECCRLSSSSSYGNKENLNTTDGKSGMPNLSIERQRMKRSRKGGGCNLRKSLAWNRAFHTEEGVLDSSELSMISRTIGKLDGDNLSVIDEGRDLSSLNSDNARPSANMKTFEENLREEFSSGYANKRSSTHGFILKRDSLAGRSLASVSKSSQKIPLTRSGSRSVSKGGVTSSPMLHSSQKMLLTVESTQAVTRNSKIPKFPVLKHDNCQPRMIINDTSSGGRCLKPIEIVQSATQKSPSLKASSTMKNASAVKARFIGTPMSAKSSTKSARNVTIKSNSETHTRKTSKNLETTSNKELPIDVVNVIDRACGISGTVVSSHSSCVNVGGSQKHVQEKGLRPSGLRKPSPSLRYFSEPKFPVSNALLKDNIRPSNLPKPSISTSRNRTALNHACHLNEDEYSQQKAKYPASLMNEERDNKDCKRFLSVESGEGNGRASIVFQKLETSTDENISENSFKPCLEVPIMNDSERNRNGEQQFVEDKGYISCVANREVTLGFEKEGTENCSTEFNKEEKHNQAVIVEYHQLHVDNNPRGIAVEAELSTVVSECLEVQNDLGSKDDSLPMNDNLFSEEEFSLKFKNHRREILNANPEVARYKLSVVNDGFETASTSNQDNVQPAHESSQLSSIADDNQLRRKSNIPNLCQNVGIDGRQDFFPNEIQQTSSNLDEDDFDVLECDDGVKSISKPGGATYSLFDSEERRSCCTNCTTVGEYNNDLSTIKVCEYSEMEQDDVSTMNDTQLTDDALFFKNEQFMLKSENHDTEETSSANADFQTQGQPELKRKSIESYITEVLIDDAVENYYSSITSQGGDIQTQSSYRHKTFNSYSSDHVTSVEYKQIAEVTIDASNQVHEKQLMAQTNDVDLTVGIVEHNSLKKDSRECLTGIYMEIEDQTSDRKLPTSPVIGCDTEEPSSSGEKRIQSRNAFMKASLDDRTEHGKIRRSLSPTECETALSENKNAMNCTDADVANSKQETYPNDQKQIGLPPNVIPFSDEWLAAIEAAGEEILTMKTGAVQNSPPDKPITEPSPWSPVKRKNNQVIGPFDCTKNRNFQHNNSG